MRHRIASVPREKPRQTSRIEPEVVRRISADLRALPGVPSQAEQVRATNALALIGAGGYHRGCDLMFEGRFPDGASGDGRLIILFPASDHDQRVIDMFGTARSLN